MRAVCLSTEGWKTPALLRVAQVELKIAGVAADAVELDVAGRVGDQRGAAGPTAGAFERHAVFVEERPAIIRVQIAIGRGADGDRYVEHPVAPLDDWRRHRRLV